MVLGVRRPEKIGKGLLLAAAVLALALFQNPLWLLAAFAVALALAVERRRLPVSARTWSALVALQAVVIAVVFAVSASGILPEYRFDVPETVVFETGIQEIDPDYYRSDQ